MKQIILIFGLFTATYCYCQNITQITYKWNTRYNEKILNGFPVNARAAIQKNIESIKHDATLNFDSSNSYYESAAQNTNMEDKNAANSASQKSNKSSNGEIISSKYSGDQYSINFKKNTITKLEKGKKITTSLPNPKWKFTKKTKKILGYTCFEALGTINNVNIIAYYTKEIKGQVIPLQMSFPAGVVLECTSEIRYCLATSVLLQQPNIVDFFKNK